MSTKAKTKAKTNAKPAKSSQAKSVAKKVTTKVSKAAKPAKPIKPVKKPVKATAKPVAKTVKKTLTKAAKPPVKAKAKSAAKPVVKSAVKSVSKAGSKSATKPANKPAKKATTQSSKPARKPVAKKAAPSASKSKVVVKETVKASAKKAAPLKSAAKAPVKASAKTPSKVTPKAATDKAGKSVAKPVEKSITPATAKAKVAAGSPVLMPIGTASSGGIPRAGRPSSRLASLTVPSMAQSTASTAAKASYAQIETSPMIVPPLPSSVKKDPKLANNWKTKSAEQLSDAELMAMPDDAYMNDKQLAAFRHRLVQLKNDILANAGETTEHLREDTVVVPDPADRATIEEEHALELRTRDRERKLLKKIEQSISRIDAGDYGYCDETGEPIGVGRLLARPTATLSLEAQQRRELKQKMFGD